MLTMGLMQILSSKTADLKTDLLFSRIKTKTAPSLISSNSRKKVRYQALTLSFSEYKTLPNDFFDSNSFCDHKFDVFSYF